MKNGCLLIIVIIAVITGGLYLNKISKDEENEIEYNKMKKEYGLTDSNISDIENDSILKEYLNGNENALIEIRKEEKIKEALITESNILYVSVYDDGTRRDGYADYLCQVLKEYKTSIKKVKVVKFGSTEDKNRNNAYGILLGESDCNF